MSLERAGATSLDQQSQELPFRERSDLFKFPEADLYAEKLWQVFLDTHPEFTQVVERNHGLEIREPLLALEQALESSETVRYDDRDVSLAEIANSLCVRGNQSAKLAATVSYDRWLERSRKEASATALKPTQEVEQTEDFDLAA